MMDRMPGSKGFEEGFVQTSFGRAHFAHKQGTGRPLILLHGMGGVLKTWTRFMGLLDMDTYALDLLGHGESARPKMDYRIDVQVGFVEEFVAQKCDKDPFIMGNSYGAWIAMEYALRNSVAGLIIEDGAVLREFDIVPSDRERMELFEALLRENDNDKTVMQSIDDNYTGMEPERISSLAVPTLILWGGADRIIDVKAGERLRTLIKGSKLIVIRNAGHVPHFSNPEQAARDVSEFIRGIAYEG